MRHLPLLSVAVVLTVACHVDTYEADVPDSEPLVFQSRGAEAEPIEGEAGVCELCPWGEIGTFSTGGTVLTDKQWVNVVNQLAGDWCADRQCRDCGTAETATCEYNSHTFEEVADDGKSATAKINCDCPLW